MSACSLIIFASADPGQAPSPDGSANAATEIEAPSLAPLRGATIGLLRRYSRTSVELGRLPSILGREFFRARVSSYKLVSFEDAVIFAYDVERCLERLSPLARTLLARIVLQEYTQDEVARMLRCTERTVRTYYWRALDELTEIFLSGGLLKLLKGTSETCQDPISVQNSATHCSQCE
jgi:hypothetical protein